MLVDPLILALASAQAYLWGCKAAGLLVQKPPQGIHARLGLRHPWLRTFLDKQSRHLAIRILCLPASHRSCRRPAARNPIFCPRR